MCLNIECECVCVRVCDLECFLCLFGWFLLGFFSFLMGTGYYVVGVFVSILGGFRFFVLVGSCEVEGVASMGYGFVVFLGILGIGKC